jgi:hypothetical protein
VLLRANVDLHGAANQGGGRRFAADRMARVHLATVL